MVDLSILDFIAETPCLYDGEFCTDKPEFLITFSQCNCGERTWSVCRFHQKFYFSNELWCHECSIAVTVFFSQILPRDWKPG